MSVAIARRGRVSVAEHGPGDTRSTTYPVPVAFERDFDLAPHATAAAFVAVGRRQFLRYAALEAGGYVVVTDDQQKRRVTKRQGLFLCHDNAPGLTCSECFVSPVYFFGSVLCARSLLFYGK